LLVRFAHWLGRGVTIVEQLIVKNDVEKTVHLQPVLAIVNEA